MESTDVRSEDERAGSKFTMTPADPNGPLMQAWTAYQQTDDYQNTLKWATKPEHTEGSLWAAFMTGFEMASRFALHEIERASPRRTQ